MPKKTIDAVTNKTKTRKTASITRPIAKELPKKFGEFTMPIPSFTAGKEQGQTTPKIDKDFKNVFSKIVGKKPRKRNNKNPNSF